jgi:hypothetical protein
VTNEPPHTWAATARGLFNRIPPGQLALLVTSGGFGGATLWLLRESHMLRAELLKVLVEKCIGSQP